MCYNVINFLDGGRMTTYSTQNPLGSADPRDLYDNAENLDEAVNTTEDRWTDRLGNERVSLASAVDPTGFAQSALNDANRAEAAADAAFVNADVYDDVATGLAATDEGEQFQVVEGAEIVRYRNESGSAVEVVRYPASEFVNIALDVASQPGLVSGEFYADDDEQPVFSITDEDGQALAMWNQQGEMDAAPSLDMAEKSQRARTEFHTEDGQPAFALTDEDGRPLYAVDENVQPIVPFISEFHTEDGQPEFAWTDRNGVVFYGIDEDGRNVVGGGGFDPSSIPASPRGLNAPAAYWDHGTLAKAPPATDLSTGSLTALTQPHTTQYAFYDQLMAENPEYVTREKLGESTNGADIYAYTFDLIRNNGSPSLFSVDEPIEIVLLSGIHGNERISQILNLMIADGVCNRWRENPVYNRLRWQCRLRIIPCVNPDGIDAGTRRNANGVDLNRNFPTGWDIDAGLQPGDPGPNPASEIETQVMMGVPALYPSTTAYIDMHTHVGSYVQWLLACNQRDANLMIEHARMMVGYQVYGAGDDESDPLSPLISDAPEGGMIMQYVLGDGARAGFIHESPQGVTASFADSITIRRFGIHSILDLINRIINREENSRTEETQ